MVSKRWIPTCTFSNRPIFWQRYIDKKYLERAPKGLNRSFRDLGIELEGKIMPIPRNPENPALAKYRQDFFEEKYGEAGKRNFDGVSQLQAMDKEGLDVAVLFPTRGSRYLGMDGLDPGLRHGDRTRLQRLAARLRRNRSKPHVRRHHGRAARHQRVHRRNSPHGQRIWFPRHLYHGPIT